MSAGVDIGFARDNPNIRAIIWAGYSGQEGARAIADVVFGKYNPGGRLPLTWHENGYVEMLPMTSMRLRPVDNLVSRPSTLSDQGGRVGKAYDRGKGSKGHYGTAGKAGGLAGRESYHPGRGPGKTGTITGVGRASGQDVTRRVTQGRPRGGPRYFEVPNKALEVPGDSRRLHTSPGRSGRLRRVRDIRVPRPYVQILQWLDSLPIRVWFNLHHTTRKTRISDGISDGILQNSVGNRHFPTENDRRKLRRKYARRRFSDGISDGHFPAAQVRWKVRRKFSDGQLPT
ncbi:hypothetical protein RD792_002353 [Penstemon davidsonii]|uniref:Glycoside hydrolase family 3 C-terminal domain-containing protein n=1 Tax=Penstemon davidsonii TaxID=160366 RepID=A0ABR0DQS1_9LAMI|nr:hypothetical protein RD792_002353 [Penstemon davidsonii]